MIPLQKLPWCVLIAWLSHTVSASVLRSDEGEATVSFSRDIRPILQLHCVMCHGGVKRAGDLKLTDALSAQSVIQSGAADQSVIVDRIASHDDATRMPPPDHGPALTEQQIEIVRKWIDQGAAWDKHWAFEIPSLPPIPKPSAWTTWVREPIDALVANQWNSLNLARHTGLAKYHPSSQASPQQWLRKATLSLTGLPPTQEQIEEFERVWDETPETAFESTVDSLLASPGFGEHWAVMWLDQVRYADSRGLGLDGPRTIWKYRDWVIDAFNSDLPFDRFTQLQLAGDLVPNRRVEDSIATAVHRLTQTNEEGGTDDEEFRVSAVIDRVNTTWQAWQGLTFGCAQCHDHPYEPFLHQDYYAFMAYFNNTSDWDLDQEFPLLPVPLEKSRYDEASRLDQQIDSLQFTLWTAEYGFLKSNDAWQPLTSMAVSSNGTEVVVEPKKPNEFHTVGTVKRDTEFAIEWTPASQQSLYAIRLSLKPLDPTSALLHAEVGTVVSHIVLESRNGPDAEWSSVELERIMVDEPEPFLNPNASLDAKNSDGFGAYARMQRERVAAAVLRTPLNVTATTSLRLKIAHNKFVLDAFPLVSRRVSIDTCTSKEHFDTMETTELKRLRREISDLRKQRSSIPSVTTPVLRELVEHLRRPTYIFLRGNFLTKGGQVQPALPVSMLEKGSQQPSSRRELADWFVSPNNPLTARVQVNRIWARLFGRGIVLSEEDFGSSGELPSNQLLLDELAFRFQHQYHWSQKRLIRDIVLSATFRQSNQATEDSMALDPENIYLTRGSRIRLNAEVIRDTMLSVANLLPLKQGGPPTHPPIPDGVWAPFQGADKWTTPERGKTDRFRRSVYTYTKRSIPYPMSAAFDAPSREFCTPRRVPSNTPIQALMALNDVTYQEAAHALAEEMVAAQQGGRAISAPSADEDPRIPILWTRVLGRKPSHDEFLHTHHFFLSAKESAGELVAWERLALLLLNHDEMFSN